MSGSVSPLPARPSLERLRKLAKELLKEHRARDAAAAERFRATMPGRVPAAGDATLADAQFVLAREHGFASWAALVHHVAAIPVTPRGERYERLAEDLVAAWHGDDAALLRINDLAPRTVTREEFRAFVPQRLREMSGATDPIADLTPADAQLFLAALHGFESWERFLESLAQPPGDPRAAPHGIATTAPFYRIDWKRNALAPGPLASAKDWDTILAVMRDLGITGLDAGGQMTDAVMARLPDLDQLTQLDIGDCKKLSDEGVRHLARMPQLQDLNLSGYPGGRITDRGLAVLRELKDLRRFQMCWQRGTSDAGVAHLGACDRLEIVDLLGTPTGDGAIAALAGKRDLRIFKSGRLVSDAGLSLLQRFPRFKTWQGGPVRYDLMSPDAEPTHLLLDGPITDSGLESLKGLDGLSGLSFFWHTGPGLTPAGLGALASLPQLCFLGCEGRLCDDEAMRRIAALPHLRMLMAQGTVASDEGFLALSRSRTIENIWGRECPNLTGRGFAALSEMPALRGLAVSCKRVNDAALATLPRFPALTHLLPMDVADDGFRHVGGCMQLETLTCMYCRDTGDVATGHIGGLPRLRNYYAGQTRITDRSLEVLGRMDWLEKVELSACRGITDAGLVHLARLPKLREVSVDASARVTRAGIAVFPAGVRVHYGT
jgi:hypothetical protein